MNAELRDPSFEIEELRSSLPGQALARFRLSLARARAAGEVWDACAEYGVAPDALTRATDRWCDELDLEAAVTELYAAPLLVARSATRELHFIHARSEQPAAIPLLLLHGGAASIAELTPLVELLTRPPRDGAGAARAFHVVCPALPGFGLSSWQEPFDLRDVARACAELMAALGYDRYGAHGNELGAGVARHLAAYAPRSVVALHVGDCPAFPGEDPLELARLTSAEKSRLALLTELARAPEPETPLQLLAQALAALADSPDFAWRPRLLDALLLSLTLSWVSGDRRARARLRRQSWRAPSGAQDVPIALCSFPLGAPSLRRFAERRYRIVEWTEHERGGCMPALEQPEVLVASLRGFFSRVSPAASLATLT